MSIEKYELTSRRYDVEQAQRWQDEVARLPWIQFPADWKVKVIPPFGDAVVRFLVTLPDGKEKSVYHDSRASLGEYFDDMDELIPYWKVYPVNGDIGRCGTDEVELLLEMIAEGSEEKEEADVNGWITDRRPTAEDANSIGSVWATYNGKVFLWDYQGVGEGMAWMPITLPDPYVEPPKRYSLVYRSTTRQYYIQDTESCDKRFVASCIPTREKADRISNIFEDQNSMSEWITDRKPTEKDGPMVYNSQGGVWHYTYIMNGDPWKPIPECEPYVKPKRFEVREAYVGDGFVVIDSAKFSTAIPVPTREAAERILAIYEETVP